MIKLSLICFLIKQKKPHGSKGREANQSFKVTSTVSQFTLNRYQINAEVINFPVISL